MLCSAITRYEASIHAGLPIVRVHSVAQRIATWWSLRVITGFRVRGDAGKGDDRLGCQWYVLGLPCASVGHSA